NSACMPVSAKKPGNCFALTGLIEESGNATCTIPTDRDFRSIKMTATQEPRANVLSMSSGEFDASNPPTPIILLITLSCSTC
ncbi:MAG: hypothetical protein KAK02_03630, partial [Desulfobulbaceae bacterium]|nr:hypothetical protein [Desulfobulbaceae bacterium]